MHYIKVLATDSTNSELKRRFAQNPRMSNTSFFALQQKEGRGQHGTTWVSRSNTNLTFSILLNDLNLKASENFKLNAAVSLSIQKFLEAQTKTTPFHIKWPNDILAGQSKLCGILIESVMMGQNIKSAIIGIGLNTNQTDFDDLPKATSLKKLMHTDYDLESLWHQLTDAITKDLKVYLDQPLDTILKEYTNHLFRKDILSQFEYSTGLTKDGIIRGISPLGKLQVQFSDGFEEFQLKEIKLIY